MPGKADVFGRVPGRFREALVARVVPSTAPFTSPRRIYALGEPWDSWQSMQESTWFAGVEGLPTGS